MKMKSPYPHESEFKNKLDLLRDDLKGPLTDGWLLRRCERRLEGASLGSEMKTKSYFHEMNVKNYFLSF
jgi:hypothetical protein